MHFYPIKKHFLYWFIWILLSLSMLLFSGRVFKLEYMIAFLILLLSLFIARKNPSPSSHLNIFGAGYSRRHPTSTFSEPVIFFPSAWLSFRASYTVLQSIHI